MQNALRLTTYHKALTKALSAIIHQECQTVYYDGMFGMLYSA